MASAIKTIIGRGRNTRMAGAGRTGNPVKGSKQNTKSTGRQKPEWASGLKHLYDSVIDEPLPDSFKDLLAKLDDEDQ